MKKEVIKSSLGILLIIIFFILSSYLIKNNIYNINSYFNYGFIGVIIYLIIIILSIVVAPISAIPFIPVASNLWGWRTTALLSILGWTIGAMIAFTLARKYGIDLVKNLIDLKKIQKLEKLIPEENIFLTIVLLRMVTPVDGVSYFFGLFSKVPFKKFTLATIIGITPFSFIIAYLGTVPFSYQILVFSIMFIVLFSGLVTAYYIKKRKNKIMNII